MAQIYKEQNQTLMIAIEQSDPLHTEPVPLVKRPVLIGKMPTPFGEKTQDHSEK